MSRTSPPTPRSPRRVVLRRIARPVRRFLAVEASGGIVLLGATAVALLWANSPWWDTYERLWGTHLSVGWGSGRGALGPDLSLRHWVNDGLMALFFLVVGLEIRHELTHGQLARPRAAALPVFAALGGMVLPAVLFAAINVGGAGSEGWGVPMATDIAFALGVLALVAPRVPSSLKVLLLAIAVVDDIGAIVVIAVFYSHGISLGWLAAGAAGIAVVVVLARAGVRSWALFSVLGIAVWLAVQRSGVHATVAGVALGLVTPVRATVADRGRGAAARRLRDALHPWTGYVVVPLFALANAGVRVTGATVADAATSRITLGIVVGLVAGKFIGVLGAVWLSTRAGIARLPSDVALRDVVPLAALAGIGFTVSLFVGGLAFVGEPEAEAKIGVLAASVLAASIGSLLLRMQGPGRADGSAQSGSRSRRPGERRGAASGQHVAAISSSAASSAGSALSAQRSLTSTHAAA